MSGLKKKKDCFGGMGVLVNVATHYSLFLCKLCSLQAISKYLYFVKVLDNEGEDVWGKKILKRDGCLSFAYSYLF